MKWGARKTRKRTRCPLCKKCAKRVDVSFGRSPFSRYESPRHYRCKNDECSMNTFGVRWA